MLVQLSIEIEDFGHPNFRKKHCVNQATLRFDISSAFFEEAMNALPDHYRIWINSKDRKGTDAPIALKDVVSVYTAIKNKIFNSENSEFKINSPHVFFFLACPEGGCLTRRVRTHIHRLLFPCFSKKYFSRPFIIK